MAKEKLQRVIEHWRQGCQIATDTAWETGPDVQQLQSMVYDRIRDETALKSQHTLLAIHRAAETVRSCRKQEKDGRATSKPEFTAPTVTYDDRTMTLFDDGTVSLTTLGKRVRCPLALPEDDDGYQFQYLDDDRWELTESTLTLRDGEFFLHIGFRRPATDVETQSENGTVLGVDLGIENLAVTSTARFFSGGELAHRHREFERRRQALQRNGSRSALRTLDRISARERRSANDLLHRVSAALVTEALAHDCSTIAFEDLTGIRDRLPDARQFHVWAFRRLKTFTEYKARAEGITVETVEPADTSRRCSRTDCGHLDESNRRSRGQFHCRACGYEAHADYNAAKNIALKHVRCGSQPSRRTGAGQCALKSGTLSPENGFTDKPRAGGS